MGQASRLRLPPPALEPFLRLANLVPADHELPDLRSLEPDERRAAFAGIIEQLSGDRFLEFRRFIGVANSGGLRPDKFPLAYAQYCILREAREVLRRLARMDKRKLKRESQLLGASLETLLYVKTNEDGRLQIAHTPLLKALEGVEVTRIRECPVCGSIFWAGRIDRPCCTKRCAHVRRTRRWREQYVEKYKVQRVRKLDGMDILERQQGLVSEESERRALASLKAKTLARRALRLPGSS